jgi:hypothetical protein
MLTLDRSKSAALLSILATVVPALLLALTMMATNECPVRADPAVIYVDKDAPGPTHDGASWTEAFTNVQEALDDAAYGDKIWVASGVYTPGNAKSDSFTLVPGVELYGGFAGGETSRDQRDWETNVTVLSGDIDGDDTTDDNGVVTDTTNTMNISGGNAYHVVTGGGVTETARLDGFTVTAGNANRWEDVTLSGAGMYNYASSPTLAHVTFSGNYAQETVGGGMANRNASSPTLIDVTFVGNLADLSGGGMYNGFSNPNLTDVTFRGNLAKSKGSYAGGGGMYNSNSSPMLTRVAFNSNRARGIGGGMYNYKSGPMLFNVIFTGNKTGGTDQSFGGGMFNTDDSSPVLTNVVFTGNYANIVGGGMANYHDCSPTLINVTFAGNWANYGGGGMRNDTRSSPTLVNCIMWGNGANSGGRQMENLYQSWPSISYSDIQGGCPNKATCGGGMIKGDPQFVAPVAASAAPTTTGDYRLRQGSPAIDAGNNLSVTVTTDLEGNPRIVDGDGDGGAVVDMGAYEAPYADVPCDGTVGGVTVGWRRAELLRGPAWLLLAAVVAILGLLAFRTPRDKD